MIVNFILYDFYKSNSDSKKYSFFVLLSISRVFKYKIIMKKFEEIYNINKILKNIMRLIQLIATILFISHLFACMWIFLAKLSSPY